MPQLPMPLIKGTFEILILRTLGWGPAHGYAISRWIRESSGDELRIEEGALYPALRRLEERGMVVSHWKRTESGRDARVYTLTVVGERAMRDEVAQWKRYVEAFTRVIAAKPHGGLV